MTNKEKAIRYMKGLGMLNDTVKAFEADDIVFFSINGFIYSLTPQMRQTISEIESQLHGDVVVWHVIHGKYKMCDGSELNMDTYLLATSECADALDKCENEGYYAFAFVNNIDAPQDSEFGDVVIAERFGGLYRVY